MLDPSEMRILRKKLEDYNGKIPHMYLDAESMVCVGISHVLPCLEDALKVSFTNAQRLKATPAEIKADYEAIQKLEPKRIASFYKRQLKLGLPNSEVDRLTNNAIERYHQQLADLYEGFNEFPSEAKLALFDIVFSMGAANLGDWITFNESVRAQDWQKAALDSARPFPITAVRNIYVQGLLEKASRVSRKAALLEEAL